MTVIGRYSKSIIHIISNKLLYTIFIQTPNYFYKEYTSETPEKKVSSVSIK